MRQDLEAAVDDFLKEQKAVDKLYACVAVIAQSLGRAGVLGNFASFDKEVNKLLREAQENRREDLLKLLLEEHHERPVALSQESKLEMLNEMSQELLTCVGAICSLLAGAGILTEESWRSARMQSISMWDQVTAEDCSEEENEDELR